MAYEAGIKTTDELVPLVLKYANDRYQSNGWDMVVETMSHSEIAAVIGDAKTHLGAVYAMARHIRPAVTRRNETQAELF